MLVPLDDFVGRCIYFTGNYDRKISSLCRRIVRPGDTVLDIGANMGVVALHLARLVGPNGVVHAFEPNPRMAELLTQSASKNGFENIRLHSTALGSSSAVLELHIPRDNAGQGSFIYHKDDFDHFVVHAPVCTLTEIVKELRINAIRLIKIDVEGFENEVLLGGKDVLNTLRPEFILLEANEYMTASFSSVPVVQTLRQAGYLFMTIPKTMLSTRVARVDVNSNKHSPTHDILAIPEEKYEEFSRQLNAAN